MIEGKLNDLAKSVGRLNDLAKSKGRPNDLAKSKGRPNDLAKSKGRQHPIINEMEIGEVVEKSTKGISLFSWALYDWANSSFAAIVQTFVFATYFTQNVAENETIGSAQWGFVNALAALIIGIGGPILGAIADHGGKRKGWIAVFTALCIFSTALLWFVKPDVYYVPMALLLVALGTIGSEYAFIFYNAMLPNLVEDRMIGRLSGWGWSLGYAGGMASLIAALFLNEIRATFLLCAVWYFIFCFPLFFFTPDTKKKGKPPGIAIREGLKQLWRSILNVGKYSNILRFLIARIFYVDGLTTLFAFGGVYAATTFGMDQKEVLLFGIALHITSGLGAFVFSWIDDWIGSKQLILLSLVGLLVPTIVILSVSDPLLFWIFGLFLGIFVGPVQAASRSLMAHLAPVGMRNEMFGFFALSGKATAFLGPLLVGWLIYLTESQRVGISVIAFFFAIGALVLLTVEEKTE